MTLTVTDQAAITFAPAPGVEIEGLPVIVIHDEADVTIGDTSSVVLSDSAPIEVTSSESLTFQDGLGPSQWDHIEGIPGFVTAPVDIDRLSEELHERLFGPGGVEETADAAVSAAAAAEAHADSLHGTAMAAADAAHDRGDEAFNLATTVTSEVTSARGAQASLSARVGQLDQARIDGDAANAASVTALSAQVNHETSGLPATLARLVTEESARASGDSANASSITALSTQLNDAPTGLPNAHARVTAEESARASGDSANASSIAALSTQVNDVTTGLPATLARLVTEESTRSSADSALSCRATALETEVQGERGGQVDLAARITQVNQARVDGDAANATSISSLSAQVNHETTGLPSTLARIVAEETARASGDTANTNAINSLSAQVNHADTGLPATLARLVTEESTRATADSANATLITTLRSQVGDLGAGVLAGKVFYQDGEPTLDQIATIGANRLMNAGFTNGTSWFETYTNDAGTPAIGLASSDWTLDGGVTIQGHVPGTPASGNILQLSNSANYAYFPVTAGHWYMASAYVAAHRMGVVVVGIIWLDNALGYIGENWSPSTGAGAGGRSLSGYSLKWAALQAPAGSARAAFVVRGFFDGSVDPYLFMTRPFFGRCNPNPADAIPWTNFVPAIWYDTNDNNKSRVWNGLAWVAADDTRIAANEAAITSEATTRATADSALASRATVLEARVISRQNLLPNGGFSNGTTGWGVTGGSSIGVADNVWGRVCNITCGTSVGAVATGSIPVVGNEWYTLHGDASLFGTGAIGYFDIVFYDAGMAVVLDSGQNSKAADFDFANDDTNRGHFAIEVQAPATAVWAQARFVWDGGTPSYAGIRQVKLERGRLPYAGFSDEGGASTAVARIAAEEIARANADSAISGTLTTVEARTNGISASGTVSMIAEAAPSGYTAAYSVKINAASTRAGFTMLAKSDGTSVIALDASQVMVRDPGVDGGVPKNLLTVSGGKFLFGGDVGINGNLVVAGTITADKVAFGIGANLVPSGGSFETGLEGWFPNGHGGSAFNIYQESHTAAYRVDGHGYLVLDKEVGASPYWVSATSPVFRIERSTEYELSCWAAALGGTGAGFYLRMHWCSDANGTIISSADVVAEGALTGTMAFKSGKLTAPANATHAKVEIYNWQSSTARYFVVDAVSLRKVIGTTMIADGTIITNHIVAETITVGKIFSDSIRNLQQSKNLAFFSTVGITNWMIPANVTQVRLRIWGAGGGGAYSVGSDSASPGGGAGGYSEKTITGLTPGDHLQIVIGAGGAGGWSGGAATAGGLTAVYNSAGTVTHLGAVGGGLAVAVSAGSTAAGGSGGTITANGVDIALTGEQGHVGGYLGNQTIPVGGNGGSCPFGGVGGIGTTGAPANGVFPGGGGGGSVNASFAGGAGARGQVLIEY